MTARRSYRSASSAANGDTSKRAAAFENAAKRAGVAVREVYWTLGHHDGVLIIEATDDPSATAMMVYLASLGNVRTQTLRAFTRAEIGEILSQVPSGGGETMQRKDKKRR